MASRSRRKWREKRRWTTWRSRLALLGVPERLRDVFTLTLFGAGPVGASERGKPSLWLPCPTPFLNSPALCLSLRMGLAPRWYINSTLWSSSHLLLIQKLYPLTNDHPPSASLSIHRPTKLAFTDIHIQQAQLSPTLTFGENEAAHHQYCYCARVSSVKLLGSSY